MLVGKTVNRYYLKYWWMFLIGIIALVIVDYAQLHIFDLFRGLINELDDKALNNSKLNQFAIELIIIAITIFIGRFVWRITILGMAINVEDDLRKRMFAYTEKLSQSFFDINRTGAQMALYTNDILMIKECFGFGTVMIVDAIVLGTMAFIKMGRLNIWLTLVSAVPLIILASCGWIIGKYMSRKWEARQLAYEGISEFTQENFSGISVIKAFVKEGLELKVFSKLNKTNQDKNVEFVRFSVILNIFINIFITSVVLLIIGLGSYIIINSVNNGNANFGSGEFIAFFGFFQSLIWPTMALAQIVNLIAQGRASLKRIDNLLYHPIDVKDDTSVKRITTENGQKLISYYNEQNELIEQVVDLKGNLEFKDLTFYYPNAEKPALENISFKINVGESVGIIGKTGSGKTTLVNLLTRVYNIENNKILIDNLDIMKLEINDIRNAISYVPQDNFLFGKTIIENIGFGLKSISHEDAKKYASMAGVAEDIEDFPLKYDTVLGERGVTVSGGQKQRISIARALAKDSKILILDDSVSAVDTKTEAMILDNLAQIHGNKTIIIIAHRISTVQKLDKIILLDNGKVIAIGKHEDLYQNISMYRDMVDLQQLEDSIIEEEE